MRLIRTLLPLSGPPYHGGHPPDEPAGTDSAVLGGLLLFLSAGGLLIWLLPFGGFAQVSVLAHTAVGIAAAGWFGVWQFRHWRATRNKPRTRGKVAAYAGFWLLAASMAAGFVITWQAIFGLYAGHLWSRVHLWTGLLGSACLAYHVIPARGYSRPGRRRTWAGALAFAGVGIVSSGAVALFWISPMAAPTAAASHPFLPSNAATESGGTLPVPLLANSEACGAAGCHTAIYEEWRASAHRWSAEDDFFQTVREATTELQGKHVTEKCGACHDPVSLISGHRDPGLGRNAPGIHEGDSCVVCHAVRRVDERGIGSYVLGMPHPYLYEASTAALPRAVNHFLIRAYPAQHSRDYSLAPVRRPDSCAPCHKEYDVIVKEQGPVQVETQYDDWKHGKWNTERNARRRLYCQQCHMYYLEAPEQRLADPYDLRAGLGLRHRNHFFAAANQFMPAAVGSPDAAGQIRRVTEWLQGARAVPEISGVWPSGPVVALRIEAPAAAARGTTAQARVVLANNKAGHGFPTGPLNINRAWIEFTVRDRTGTTLFHSGRLDAENHIEAGSYVLKPLAIDLQGRMILEADLWHPQGPQYRPAILAGQSAAYDYAFPIPADAPGPLTLEARLRYRKANQFFMDSVYPGQHRTAPITDVSAGRAVMTLNGAAEKK